MKTRPSRTIEIVVSPDGQSSVETKGFVGSDCLAASRFIEESLGGQAALKRTAEFFATSEASVQQQAEQG